ncbi:MAG TPA: hypothetical protein IAD10_07165, partial [Candidatus Fimicola cottocaccae]|nr:hypothetical protein [Candidatus Fimicola cottocaccae]
IILFILSGTFTPSNSDEGDKFLIPEEHGIVDIENIQSYEFGNELTSVLNQIGISNMGKSSFEVVNERTITIRMNIDDLRVWIALNKDYYDDVWKVEFIKNYDDKEYVYYLDDEQKYINGLLKQNIYSFPDNVIIEKVDENSLNQYYAELEKQNQQRKKEQQEKEKQAEQQKRLDAVNIIDEIYNAYDNNELKADELYKGKEYLILGKFDGASDDGLFNNLLKEVSVSIIVEHPNRNYILSCSFDKELWRDKILTLNKGDEIFIKGECYSWGVWSNCSIEE